MKVFKNTESKATKFYLKNSIYKRKCLLDSEGKIAVLEKEEEDEILDSKAMQEERGLTAFGHRMFLDDSEVFALSTH